MYLLYLLMPLQQDEIEKIIYKWMQNKIFLLFSVQEVTQSPTSIH